MKDKKKLLLVFGVLGLILLSLALKRLLFSPEAKTAPKKQNQALQVEAFIASKQSLTESFETKGELKAFEEAQLAAERNGRITQWHVQDGQLVTKGQVLVEIFHEDLQAQMQGLVAKLKEARLQSQRLAKLKANQNISERDFESAQALLQSLIADSLVLAVQINQSMIRAPFPGRVGLRNVSTGTYATVGTPLISLVQTDPLKLDIDVPDKYARKLREKQPLKFVLNHPDTSIEANISALSPSLDANSRVLKARAFIANPNQSLPAGGFGTVHLSLASIPNAVVVPSQALIPEIRGHRLVLYKSGKAVSQEVVPGLRVDSLVQIVEGIQAGDTVLTTGILQARPGKPLTIKRLGSLP